MTVGTCNTLRLRSIETEGQGHAILVFASVIINTGFVMLWSIGDLRKSLKSQNITKKNDLSILYVHEQDW